MEDGKGRRAVIEGSLPEVEQTRPDDTTVPQQEAPPESAGAASPSAHIEGKPSKRRRNRGLVRKSLGRVWIPLVVFAVLAGGGLTVSRLHGIFGNDTSLTYSDTKNDKGKPFNPRS